jgi:hypothetical protein
LVATLDDPGTGRGRVEHARAARWLTSQRTPPLIWPLAGRRLRVRLAPVSSERILLPIRGFATYCRRSRRSRHTAAADLLNSGLQDRHGMGEHRRRLAVNIRSQPAQRNSQRERFDVLAPESHQGFRRLQPISRESDEAALFPSRCTLHNAPLRRGGHASAAPG